MIVNKKELADVHGVSERTLTEWQEDGMPIESVGGRGMENQYDTAKTIEWRAQRAVAGKAKMTPRDERDHYEAKLSQLELARESGKLVAVDDVGPVWEGAILAARTGLLGLPPVLKAMIDARYGINLDQQMIEDEVHNALRKLSEHPPEDDEDAEVEEALEDESE